MFLVDREEESLQAHGKERRQSDVEDRVEENDLACVGKKLNQIHWQNHQKELSRESKPFTQSFIESSLSSLQPRRRRVLRIERQSFECAREIKEVEEIFHSKIFPYQYKLEMLLCNLIWNSGQ
jgi:hypothetical protein